jgi:hypothetical protein
MPAYRQSNIRFQGGLDARTVYYLPYGKRGLMVLDVKRCKLLGRIADIGDRG